MRDMLANRREHALRRGPIGRVSRATGRTGCARRVPGLRGRRPKPATLVGPFGCHDAQDRMAISDVFAVNHVWSIQLSCSQSRIGGGDAPRLHRQLRVKFSDCQFAGHYMECSICCSVCHVFRSSNLLRMLSTLSLARRELASMCPAA